MPFTFSHPALVLPATFLPKRFYSLTGLVAGSVVPDFEYFLRMSTRSDYSHTIPGMFWFDLPLGLVLAIIFHQIIRNPLIDHLPFSIRSRFADAREFHWMKYFRLNWFVVLVSVIVGTITHLFWDSFTHINGYFVQAIPLMFTDIDLLGYPFTLYRFLQHLSTVIGIILIAIAIYRMPKQIERVKRPIFNFWMGAILISFAVVGLRTVLGHHHLFHHMNQLIVTGVTGGLVGLLIMSLTSRIYEFIFRKSL